MEELARYSDVEQAAVGDGHLVWAAQGRADDRLGPGVRAWRHGTAVIVASPDISRRDRLAVRGDGADVAVLVRRVLDEVGPSYRPFGEASSLDALAGHLPGLVPVPGFFWMDTTSESGAAAPGVGWLEVGEERDVAAMFDDFYPDSHAQPGRGGVRRWAGAAAQAPGEAGSQPMAVAADAWSAAGCGFIAGVLTHPAARGRGLGRAVCGFVVDHLVRHHGRAALMVEAGNLPAVATYERLGMKKRLFAAARTGSH
ncbi:GNAT family N-acetyltransferase [Streptomyces sp. NBC_01718]|uniref:GNAT family N-acetyltransferase n=1 Tax=Streptomyces sp. NBC_01718 TaxID=2975919 RepID=UPI002F91AB8D